MTVEFLKQNLCISYQVNHLNINFSSFKLKDRNMWLRLFIAKTQYYINNKSVIFFSGLIVLSFLAEPGWTGLGAFMYFSLLILI